MSETTAGVVQPRVPRVHGVPVSATSVLRALGCAAVLAAFALHDLFIRDRFDPLQFWLIAAGVALYGGGAAVTMHHVYSRPREAGAFDVNLLFQVLDVVLCLVLVYFSGGEESWLILLVPVPVMNQTHISTRHALLVGHVATAGYAIALLLRGVGDVPAAATKVLLLYIAVAFVTAVAVLADRYRTEVAVKLRKAKSLAERLQVAGRAASESLELPEVLARVLEQLRFVIAFDGASIQLIEGEAMRVIALRGLPESDVGRVFKLANHPYNRRVAESREPVILDLPAPEMWRPIRGREDLRTVMGVPLIARDVTIGALSIDSTVEHAFSERDVEVVKAFAAQVSIAIENARVYEALRELSWHDPLTGVANRRRFDEVLADEWRRAERTAAPVAVMMIDIDHFKLYNDHYGHAAGDAVLRSVAVELQNGFNRAGEFFARYGGEEFVALLPSTSLPDAVTRAKGLCARVRGLNIPHARSSHGAVTVSIGASAAIPHADSSAAALVAEADQALYEAKRAGRNRAAGAFLV